ncbi:MAG: sodium/solute symporter [Luteolibacter sp.]
MIAFVSGISGLDLTIVVGYILGITALGCYAGMRKKGAENRSKEYFLAGGHLKWPMIGLSLFATNISCYHLVGLAENGFTTGLLYGNFEWMAVFTLALLALFFVPFYLRSKVATLPDFLEKRFDRASRDWLAVLSIVSSIVIHITFSFVAGGAVLHSLFGWDEYTAILTIACITGLYTIIGGLAAVVWTETIQTVVLLGGAAAITIACWMKTGGWAPVADTIATTGETSRLSMLQTSGEMPWYAVALGYPVLGIWYWCADQTIVQRVLGAKDEHHARLGPLFAGVLKILPVFVFVVPGMFAWALWKHGQLDLSSITVAGKVNTKELYTTMILQLLPPGLVGLLVAALLAGLMSNVAASLNSISTLASFDLYKRNKPDAPDAHVLRVGRFTAGIALVLGVASYYAAKQYANLFSGINDVISHIAPPITCVFLFGVFWGRASAFAAKWTLWLGSALGAGVFAAGKLLPPGSTNPVLHFLTATPFMMMAFWLFCACCAIMFVLSLMRPQVHTGESSTLYWKSPLEPLRQPGLPGLRDYRLLTALLIAAMCTLYYVFR